MICYLSVDSDVSSAQVPVFQRGGSVVCRSVGSCSCTAELRQLPLSVTVALNSQVTCAGYWNPTPMGSYFHTDKTNFFSMSLNFALWISHKDLIYGLFVVPFFSNTDSSMFQLQWLQMYWVFFLRFYFGVQMLV